MIMTLLRYSGRGGRGGRVRGGRGSSTRHAVAAKKSNQWVRPIGVDTNDNIDEEAETKNHMNINSTDVNDAQLTAKSSNNDSSSSSSNNEEVLPLPQQSGNSVYGKNCLENLESLDVSRKSNPLNPNSAEAASYLRHKSQHTRFGSHAWKRTDSDTGSKDRNDAETELEGTKPVIEDNAGTMLEAAKSSKSEGWYAASENTSRMFEAVEGVSVAKAAPKTTSTNQTHLQQEGLLLKLQSENNQSQSMDRVNDSKLASSESGDLSSSADTRTVTSNGEIKRFDNVPSSKSSKNDVASYVSSRKGTSLRRPTATVDPSLGGSAFSSTHKAVTENHQRSVETKISSHLKLGAHKNKWVRSSAEDTLFLETKMPPPFNHGKEETPAAKLKYSTVVVAPAASTYRHGHSTGRRRPHHRRTPTATPAPKRIKISHARNGTKKLRSSDHEFEEDHEGGKEMAQQDMRTRGQTENVSDSSQPQGKTKDDAVVTEKLTDFAYRETNVGRGKKTKSRGLVRVQPQAAPICATFLRGMQCTDETCMKRHDVPKEYAMPVCSFFQRQGMCLKENCRFRHVKVNPRAMPCPSFELLGFCGDPNCTMMHKRPAAVKNNMSFDRKSASNKKL